MGGSPRPGSITWTDLTVDDAERVRDFYHAVTGWTPVPLSMGTYADFVMKTDDGEEIAGICHARGSNADLPPVWLVYITVDDLDHSLDQCHRHGGSVLTPPRSYAGGRYCVIKDPAGAICALYQPSDAA
jgi:predicted enzyme related to lactoylglutathione lyase